MTTDHWDVWTGIDVLRRGGFSALQGRRVGLVTNHTGRARDGRMTADVLHHAPDVTLTALFGPEHGIRGAFDQPQIDDGVDAATGLPVYSLYGAHYAPTEVQLANVDLLVFDIQDIGCRFYTYISTLGHVLEAASAVGMPVLVLDRPNPITGKLIEGPLADTLSFTAFHPLPIRHGMTVGEIARMMHQERELTGDLHIVRCEGWRREDWYDATGLLWVNPSPNMRTLTQATLYPGIGLLELTNLSVGRGTDTPFEKVGAPWIEARSLAAVLNKALLPGVRALPVEFTPRASIHTEIPCGGVALLVTDRERLNAVQLGLTVAHALRELYPSEWETTKLGMLLAHQATLQGVLASLPYSEIAASWTAELESFTARRQQVLLYE